MSQGPYIEVLTGDLIRSRDLPAESRRQLPERLEEALAALTAAPAGDVSGPPRVLCYEVSRGDSFQVVLVGLGKGLRALLYLVAHLEHRASRQTPLLARAALGVGRADYLEIARDAAVRPWARGFHADGEVFVRSGELLERLKRERRRVGVETPWPGANAELAVACLFLDETVRRWTAPQAIALLAALQGEKQADIARHERVTQPAVAQRLRAASLPAVAALLARYEALVTALAGGEPATAPPRAPTEE